MTGRRQVLQVLRDDVNRDNLWIAFPFATPAIGQRCRVERIFVPGDGELDRDRDVAVFELADMVPAGVKAVRLKCPPAQALVGARWWAWQEGLCLGPASLHSGTPARHRARTGNPGGS